MTVARFSCRSTEKDQYVPAAQVVEPAILRPAEPIKPIEPIEPIEPTIIGPANSIQTGNTNPDDLVAYSQTLLGVPYLYASSDPSAGFDCSGFITYVFNHFNIKVPRSSVDFTNEGAEVPIAFAKSGDLILFTGTDSTIRRVGHMGIVVSNYTGNLQFIHSTSGKSKGVVITPFEDYYKSRFVKVIRVFPDK